MDTTKKSGVLDAEVYAQALELARLGQRAAARAREECRRQDVPIPFERDGELYFELPDGTITQEDPFADDEEASER